MNITELIERMRVFEADHEPDGWPAIRMREVSALCDSLLEQQRVIEKMREALIDEYNYQCAHCHEPNHNLSEALARQPDLSALREHDAEVCQEFANFLGIEKREDVVKWIEHIRKGE